MQNIFSFFGKQGRIHPFLKHNAKWPIHLQFVAARPQAGAISFSQYVVSSSWWSITCTGFQVCTVWFALSFSLLQTSDPKVVHTDLHCSSSTALHSNDASHPSLSSSNRVSRSRAFTPQSHTENTLSGIFIQFWRSEVHVLRLRIRIVRQDLASVHSDVFGSCFLIWVCFFNDYRWSTLHTFFVCIVCRHMMCAPF